MTVSFRMSLFSCVVVVKRLTPVVVVVKRFTPEGSPADRTSVKDWRCRDMPGRPEMREEVVVEEEEEEEDFWPERRVTDEDEDARLDFGTPF